MAKRKRCDLPPKEASPPPKEGDLIQILVRLPIKYMIRFKSVCKSWFALIESSSFIDLYATTTFNSSNKFGSFILLASVDKRSPKPYKTSKENSLILLSSESKSKSKSGSVGGGGGGGGGGWRWWSTTGDQPDDDDDYEDQMFNLGGSSNDQQQQQQQLELQMDSLGVPSCYEHCYFFKKIVGSCNGLVCLHDTDVNRVSLWNPATKKHRILPKPIKFGVDWPHHLAAFGFDFQTKDYKVVLLTGRRPEYYRAVSPIERLCRVQVYSLSTDSWRLVEGITSLPGDPFLHPTEGLYLNGCCFFMAHFFRNKYSQLCIPENDRFLISFDLTKEIITPIQLPDHHRDQTLYLSRMADKMALFTVKYQPRLHPYPPTGFCDDYNVWASLNEHGGNSSSSSMNKDSWTELHSFQIEVERPDEKNIPRGISNDGNFALLEIKDSTGLGKRMKLYHLVSKQVKKNFLSCGSVMSKAHAYKPSLVSIIGGGNGAAY